MKRSILVGLLVAGIIMSAGPAFATSISFGEASGYNAFFFSNFTAEGSDVEGALAVGRNVSLTNYSVGVKNSMPNALVAGGNVQMSSGQINGNVVAGGNLKTTSAQINGNVDVGGNVSKTWGGITGSVTQHDSTLPLVNFSTARSQLTSLSNSLHSTATTGTTTSVYGGIQLTGNGSSTVQVFNISGSDLASSNYWRDLKDVPTGATVVINVSGTSVFLTNAGMNPLKGYNTLFNFYEAETLGLGSFMGSILAPHADIIGNYGAINGTVIADSFNGHTQINNVPFHETPAAVPIPGAIVLLGSGLIGVAGIRGRFRFRK